MGGTPCAAPYHPGPAAAGAAAFVPCARKDCRCAAWDGVQGSFCCPECREGKACTALIHPPGRGVRADAGAVAMPRVHANSVLLWDAKRSELEAARERPPSDMFRDQAIQQARFKCDELLRSLLDASSDAPMATLAGRNFMADVARRRGYQRERTDMVLLQAVEGVLWQTLDTCTLNDTVRPRCVQALRNVRHRMREYHQVMDGPAPP